MISSIYAAAGSITLTLLTQSADRNIPLEVERDALARIAMARFAMMLSILAIVAGLVVMVQEVRKMQLPKEEREKGKNKVSIAAGLMMFGLMGSVMPSLNPNRPSNTQRWNSHSEKGHQLLTAKQFAAAKSEFEQALAALDPKLPGDMRKASTLVALAGLDQMNGDFASAESRAREALPILEHDANSTPKAKGICLLLLANACYQQQKMDEGMRIVKQGIDVISRGISESAPELAQAHSIKGLIEITNEESIASKASFDKALAIADAAPDGTVANLGTCLNNLAQWNQLYGDAKSAEDYYLRAIRIFEQSPTQWKNEYALTIENYALFLEGLGRTEEAQKLRGRTESPEFGN